MQTFTLADKEVTGKRVEPVRQRFLSDLTPTEFLVKVAGVWHRLYVEYGISELSSPYFIIQGTDRLVINRTDVARYDLW